mmetsp:Transcript_4590/g.14891  ORF Transcript_4590/g.14891 Transcript_4590/m.14891 type:complete len:206 (-) Transcript_4590:1380-1997(-)
MYVYIYIYVHYRVVDAFSSPLLLLLLLASLPVKFKPFASFNSFNAAAPFNFFSFISASNFIVASSIFCKLAMSSRLFPSFSYSAIKFSISFGVAFFRFSMSLYRFALFFSFAAYNAATSSEAPKSTISFSAFSTDSEISFACCCRHSSNHSSFHMTLELVFKYVSISSFGTRSKLSSTIAHPSGILIKISSGASTVATAPPKFLK